MKAITLRNLPQDVVKAVTRKAREENLSLNQAVISLLESALGLSSRRKPVLHHDLDRFSGIWPAREAKALLKDLLRTRKIDPEQWK